MSQEERLSVADFLVILIKKFWFFTAIWILVLGTAILYLALAKKTYRLQGTIFVGRFQEDLLEEGEFVAHKLQDYSFAKKALGNAGLNLDIPIIRLGRFIDSEVLNEVKKVKDVGLVQLTVEYKDQQKCYEIYKALTDQLIDEHGQLLAQATSVLKEMHEGFARDALALEATVEEDEKMVLELSKKEGLQVPSHLLLAHSIAEKRGFHNKLLKDIGYLKIEEDSATKSFNTKLASPPEIPDEHYKPKRMLTLILGVIIATIVATMGTLLLHLYQTKVQPRLKQKA